MFRLGPTQKTAVQLLGLVLSIIASKENENIDEMSEMYKSDLPSPHTLDIEHDKCWRKWKSEVTKPASLRPALEVKHLTLEVHLIETIKITLFIELMTMIFVSLSTRPMIPTFSVMLTVCCKLLAPCQALQPTTSEQTVLWSLSKDIYIPPRQQKDCQAWLWWTFITKSSLTTMLLFSFLRKDIPEECFSFTVYFNHSFINENLHVLPGFVIF